MIPQVPDHANTYHYPENDFDYDTDWEFRGHQDVYDNQWNDPYQDHNNSSSNRHPGMQFRGGYTDSEAFDPHSLPHSSFWLPEVSKNDIKARSEKYKHELAVKLSKIRDELNVKDSKIENLLYKIGANT